MSAKTIDLIVLKFQQPKRVPLAELSLDYLHKKATYGRRIAEEELQFHLGGKFPIQSLVQIYSNGIVRLYNNLFRKIVGDEAGFETLTSVHFAYASPEAYDLIKPKIPKEKKDDTEIIPAAHFGNEGVVLSVREHYPSEFLLEANIHEHGHYLHWRLHPKEYEKSDATMKEVMAELVELYCRIPLNYIAPKRGETSHSRAQQLLKKFQKTKLWQQMRTVQRWKFLVGYAHHEELQQCLDNMLKTKE